MIRCQSKILRQIVDAPWYITNQTLHADLHVPAVKEIIHEKAVKHHDNLGVHLNPLLEDLLEPIVTKRLKRQWPLELV
nr:unnamed protein product [Callosobruchus chinensis]